MHKACGWLFRPSLGLNGISYALMAATGDTVSLGLAPLHAMTMGYLGCTMFSMVTRVASGHGGRKESADNAVWWLYWALQTAVALRVVAAVAQAYAQALVLTAVAAWCVAMVCWALRYGYWFGRGCPNFCVQGAQRLVHGGGRRLRRTSDAVGKSVVHLKRRFL